MVGVCFHCGGQTYRDDIRDRQGRRVSSEIVRVCLQCGRVQPPTPEALPRAQQGSLR